MQTICIKLSRLEKLAQLKQTVCVRSMVFAIFCYFVVNLAKESVRERKEEREIEVPRSDCCEKADMCL